MDKTPVLGRKKEGVRTKSAKASKTSVAVTEPQKPVTFEFLPNPGSDDYNSLIKIVLSSETQADHLVQLLKYLEQNICRLEGEYKSLVLAILSMNWLGCGPELIATFQAFALNLVSAHLSYLRPCVKMLVKRFIPEEVNKDSSTPSLALDTSHIHSLLKSLSTIVPMTIELLPQVLEDLFPYINKSIHIFDHYTQSLLDISLYLPSLRMGILELIVCNMLKLDVRTPRVDISTAIYTPEDEETNPRDEAMFEMDVDASVNHTTVRKKRAWLRNWGKPSLMPGPWMS
ncbi:hypothetical protein EGW08_021796 [Elysia chlorotica]|uniref:Pre-rRNA-processing protein Ipi1 N-terminal domain-containing protein n=1 Tax=Elysia chlorotica TaxID=188477 RepID=A0A433SMR7_ELYCH|nr:hypothetical protein EGW08_021796 [Elysia chlorotica]